MNRTHTILTGILSLSLLLAGCSTSPSNVSNRSVPNNSSKGNPSPSKKDGTIISMTLVHAEGQNPNIKIYKMFYWSQGYQVEAFLTEPKDPGPHDYPLEVLCHGGYSVPPKTPKPSIVNIENLSATIAATASKYSQEVIELFPEYRGYPQSKGTIADVHSNTIDTENAITAAESLSVVNGNLEEFEGTSMGGAVALQVLSNAKYSSNVAYAVIVSPFAGWDVAMSWAENHPDNGLAKKKIRQAQKYDGVFSPSKPDYKENSIDIPKIDPSIPILIMQGTDDTHAPWQATQLLAQKMKTAGDTVQLHLVPGGNHALTGKYEKGARKYINQWVQQIYR